MNDLHGPLRIVMQQIRWHTETIREYEAFPGPRMKLRVRDLQNRKRGLAEAAVTMAEYLGILWEAR